MVSVFSVYMFFFPTSVFFLSRYLLIARFGFRVCVTIDSNFEGSDFTNAIVDRASFQGSSLKGAIFTNAVLTGTSFEGANVENADFSDSYIGDFDSRNLCKNPTLKGENPTTGVDTRFSAGCK